MEKWSSELTTDPPNFSVLEYKVESVVLKSDLFRALNDLHLGVK